MITQLIINGMELPKTSNDKYTAYPDELGVTDTMVNGRMVFEVRGTVWMIEYSYDHMPDTMLRQLLPYLQKKQPVQCFFREPTSDEMQSGVFLCTSPPRPTVAFFDAEGNPIWHNVKFTLREVESHD